MSFLERVLVILDTDMTPPTPYGWFHLLTCFITVAACVLLCIFYKNATPKQILRIVLITAIAVLLFEVYKQINYTFSVTEEGIKGDYQWYAFPFQFCSTPMYIGLLTGIFRKGKVHDALSAFLATYAIFAGLCVMVYPAQIFISTIGINIQTTFCHGSMIVIGIFLFYTGHVKLSHKTILKAMPVFASCMLVAFLMNEVVYATVLPEGEVFNMFFISRHFDPSLPVFSLIQPHVPFVISLVIYFIGFTAAAYIVLLAAMGIHKLVECIKNRLTTNSSEKKGAIL